MPSFSNQNVNNYHILRQEIREFQFSEDLLNQDSKAIKDIETNPLISDSKNCLSIKAKEHWYYIQVLMSYLKKDFKAGLSFSSQYVRFMNENLYLFGTSKRLPALSNYIYHAALTRDEVHFVKGIQLLNELSLKKEVSQFYIKYISYTRNLEYFYYTNNEKLTEEYLGYACALVEDYIEEFEEPQIQYLFLLIVRAAISLNKNDLGMYYCNLWHRRGVLVYRKVQARLFSVMINFELKHFELIQSEIILLKKLEKKNPREKMLIKVFYSFLNSVLKYPNQKNALIGKLQQDLKSISINNKGYFDFISFDYYQWSLRLSIVSN